MTATSHSFIVREWKPYAKNTLIGFLSLELPGGMVLRGCALHKKNSSRWSGLPAGEYEKHGNKTWTPLVEFVSKEAREKFQAAALAAVDRHLGEEELL